MNLESELRSDSFQASRYILENFEPADRIAVLIRNQRSGEVLQRITAAKNVASSDFQAWLRHKNAHGSDIYTGMNSLKPDAKSRTKEDIAAIRHLYLDIDDHGPEALAAIRHSGLVPRPNYVLESSPQKFQVIWKVKAITQDGAEGLQRAMVREFGADPAATDSTRVLRLPGFTNHKYEREFVVKVRAEATETYSFEDFKLRAGTMEELRSRPASRGAGRVHTPGRVTQSERDWAYAWRALVRGDDPEEVIRRIADYRAGDKQNPDYYARHTVQKVRATLESRATGRNATRPAGDESDPPQGDHDLNQRVR